MQVTEEAEQLIRNFDEDEGTFLFRELTRKREKGNANWPLLAQEKP